MNPTEELPALRVLAKERITLYQDIRNLLHTADNLYLAAQPFDEQIMHFPEEEIPESDLIQFVETQATQLLMASARTLSATYSLATLVRVFGYEQIAAAFDTFKDEEEFAEFWESEQYIAD